MASERYDQAFFLALAAKGKDAWNAWRRAPPNKAVRVVFAGLDFSTPPGDAIDFSGFHFGDGADFSGCTWRGHEWGENLDAFTRGSACFAGAVFGDFANFAGAVFGKFADFAGAVFGSNASFAGCVFGPGVSFSRALFADQASFEQAPFGSTALFVRAAFGRRANFSAAAFGDYAKFIDAAFEDEAAFQGAVFGGGSEFYGTIFGDRAEFAGAHFKGSVSFAAPSELLPPADLTPGAEDGGGPPETGEYKKVRGPCRLLNISFANARFDGLADFSGRPFEGAADFTHARFSRRPNFDGALNPARIDLAGAQIGFAQPRALLRWAGTALSGLPSAFLEKLRKR